MKVNIQQLLISLLVITIVMAFSPIAGNAQSNDGTFIMSSVGSIQNLSNNSMSITFSSNIACLNVQNGTTILTSEKGTGLFNINCVVKEKFNTLGIKLFPNPVNAISKLQFLSKPPLNENFVITIWTADGFNLYHGKATGDEIFQGKNVDLSSLPSGSFVIQVESQNFIDALKFIKAK